MYIVDTEDDARLLYSVAPRKTGLSDALCGPLFIAIVCRHPSLYYSDASHYTIPPPLAKRGIQIFEKYGYYGTTDTVNKTALEDIIRKQVEAHRRKKMEEQMKLLKQKQEQLRKQAEEQLEEENGGGENSTYGTTTTGVTGSGGSGGNMSGDAKVGEHDFDNGVAKIKGSHGGNHDNLTGAIGERAAGLSLGVRGAANYRDVLNDMGKQSDVGATTTLISKQSSQSPTQQPSGKAMLAKAKGIDTPNEAVEPVQNKTRTFKEYCEEYKKNKGENFTAEDIRIFNEMLREQLENY